MSTIEQITITNCGPIQHVSIPFVPGKINVLRGRNGSGKSTVLEHVEQAMTGRGKGNVRDGAASGSVDAFGVTVKLGRSTRRSGELQVESIEGKFNISDLIDPGYQDGKAADARRIKAFAQIQKVLPSADLFYPLVGGRQQLEKVARPASLQSDDLVQMAEKIKADLQDAAKKEEDQAVHAEGHANGARQAAEGVDLDGESDPKVLQAALNQAIAEEARLKADQAAAVKAAKAHQLAADQLADAEAEYQGPTLAEAQAAEERAKEEQAKAEGPAKELAVKLQELQHSHALANQRLNSAGQAQLQAQNRDDKAKAEFHECEAKIKILREQLRIAEEALSGLGAKWGEATIELGNARSEKNIAAQAEEQARALVDEYTGHLSTAKQNNELACQAVAAAVSARKTAEAHESTMKTWREQVAAAIPVAPAPELLEAAAAKVAECNRACDQGALIRKAKEHQADAERHIQTASAHRKRAQELRDAAKGTDDVLSDIVARSGSQLRVEQGRLVLDTPRRGKTLFHELSAGERARIAIDIGIDAMPEGRPGAIVIKQEIFEGLDVHARKAIAEHIAERGVGILTAEAGEQDEITPEVYEPATAAVA